jgi:hypothetical protein
LIRINDESADGVMIDRTVPRAPERAPEERDALRARGTSDPGGSTVMTAIRTTSIAAFALALTLGAAGALAQAAPQPRHGGTQQHAQMGCPAAPGPGMIGQGMGPGMMGQCMGPGMMGPGMGPGMMMGQGTGSGMGGWSGLEGRRVVPMMQLSANDVRVFFERYLESLGNARLKIGKVAEADNHTITAEIVTVDDSLVEKFEVDRHTGVISAAG